MRNSLYILGQLDDGDVEWIIAHGAKRALEPGEILITQGRHVDAMSIVLEGMLTVEVDSRQIAQRGPGEILGEMSFVDGSPPSATVRASERSVLLSIPRAAVSAHLQLDTAFAARFYRSIAMVLSARIRERLGDSGTAAEESDFPGLGPGIDDDVLANVHLAGARCAHLLRRLDDPSPGA
ncbi:MAG TPA: cyclic nucleotide-binding domain-containing protein [Acidimicrobiales bacterium]